jgi:threonine aldolase
MRRAMYEAEVGDDVFGEDPTVKRLQEAVADLLGKEAALFVPSGVMGNQLALKVHTRPGDEVIVERGSHIFNYESGAAGLLSGAQLLPLEGTHGILKAEQVSAAIRPGHYWEPQSRLACLENTHNKAGGVIYPLGTIKAVAEAVRTQGLAFHLDGARLWNATAATGIPERNYAAPFDTVSVCLSKGLGAPVGSVLAGKQEHIEQAHRYRKLFGGGMRQVGILAAAGLHALEHHRPLLAEDHEKARVLAEGIAEFGAFHLDPQRVETNIVMFDVADGGATSVLEALRQEGVLMVPFSPTTIRATTHRDVSLEDIHTVLAVMNRLYGPTVAAS